MKTLVLGLGNDLLSDDAIGILAARELKREVCREIEVVESSIAGVAMIDLLIGYRRAVIIDAIFTGKYEPGTIIELDPGGLSSIPNPSPHYTGLPEMLKIAENLEIDFPDDIRILAVEVADPHTIGGEVSVSVAGVLDELILRVKEYLRCWEKEAANA
jgi:hydrogenase maturation protease